jgi:hypothetical protein
MSHQFRENYTPTPVPKRSRISIALAVVYAATLIVTLLDIFVWRG